MADQAPRSYQQGGGGGGAHRRPPPARQGWKGEAGRGVGWARPTQEQQIRPPAPRLHAERRGRRRHRRRRQACSTFAGPWGVGRGPPAGTTVDEGAPHQHGGGKRRPTGRQQRGSEPTLVQQLPTQRGACVARGTDAWVCPQSHHPPLAGKRAHTPRAPPRRAGCRARSGSPATQTGCGPATFHAMFLPTNRPPPDRRVVAARGGGRGGVPGVRRGWEKGATFKARTVGRLLVGGPAQKPKGRPLTLHPGA